MNTMNMPGFTADLSLNKLRECYAMTSRGAIARGAVVVGQDFGPLIFNIPELVCTSCYNQGHPVTCGVYNTDLLSGNTTYLGDVDLPENCWYECYKPPR